MSPPVRKVVRLGEDLVTLIRNATKSPVYTRQMDERSVLNELLKMVKGEASPILSSPDVNELFSSLPQKMKMLKLESSPERLIRKGFSPRGAYPGEDLPALFWANTPKDLQYFAERAHGWDEKSPRDLLTSIIEGIKVPGKKTQRVSLDRLARADVDEYGKSGDILNKLLKGQPDFIERYSPEFTETLQLGPRSVIARHGNLIRLLSLLAGTQLARDRGED